MAPGTLRPLLRYVRAAAGPAGDDQTDRQLLARFAAGRDPAAFAELVRRHGRLVLAACRRVLGDPADVEDAFQATFLVLLRKAPTAPWRTSVGAWLYGVAHRVACQARKDDARRRRRESRAAERATRSADPPDLSWREACATLHVELDRLPDKYRLPLLLCYLEGKSRDEAARALGWSLGTVKGRLERGRDVLRGRLVRRGVTLSAGLLGAVAADAPACVPAQLVDAAVRAASLPELPAGVALLTHDALRASSAIKVQAACAALTVAAALAAGIGLTARRAPADDPPPAARPAAPAADAPVRVVNVRVLGPDGQPQAGARLFLPRVLKSPPQFPEDVEFAERGTTDADGRCRLTLAPAEAAGPLRLTLLARADGLGCDWSELTNAGDELTLRLARDVPIEGRIVGTEGRPVAGAAVGVNTLFTTPDERLDGFLAAWPRGWQSSPQQVLKRAYGPLDRALPAVRTGADGRFRITGVGVERVALLDVAGPGIARASVWVAARPGLDVRPLNRAAVAAVPAELRDETDPQLYGPAFDYVAAPGKTIEGMVRDAATGRPLAGVTVDTEAAYNAHVAAVTDAEGRYRLAGVPKQRTYLVGAEPPDGSPYVRAGARPDDTPGLQPVRADLTLARGVVVTGRLTDRATGRPVPGGLRYAPLPENTFFGKPGHDSYKYERLTTPVEADGRFRIVVIPGPGVLMAQAHQTEGAPGGLRINPFRQAEFTPEERKRVPVADEDDGARYFIAAANARESLELNHAVKLLDLAEGSGPVTCDLSLERGRTLAVQVQGPDGRPVAGAHVAGLTDLPWRIHTLPSADATVHALDPDRPRRLVFFHADRRLAGVLTVRGDEVEPPVVRLAAAGAVTGRVLDADGQPVASATVELSSSGPAGQLYRRLHEGRELPRTGPDGRFRLDGIIPDLKFALSIRRGQTLLVGTPRIGHREVAPGRTLDLGEVRTQSHEE
jgi:RNA polymerase sigma factor (sigma-70 family)